MTHNRPVPAAPSPLNLGLLEPKEPQGPPTKCQCPSKGSACFGVRHSLCVALGEPSPSLSLTGQSTKARRWREPGLAKWLESAQGEVAAPLGRSGRKTSLPGIWAGQGVLPLVPPHHGSGKL